MEDGISSTENVKIDVKNTDSLCQTINILTQKLKEAELDSNDIGQQLLSLGFGESQSLNIEQRRPSNVSSVTVDDLLMEPQDNEKRHEQFLREENADENYDLISPYKIRTASPDTLRKNYEKLVARLCRIESQLTSIKLHVCSFKTERDLSRRAHSEINANLVQSRELYEQELRNLEQCAREAVQERDSALQEVLVANDGLVECKRVMEKNSSQCEELRTQLESVKHDASQSRRAKENLSLELARESELRLSLEQSQNALLERVLSLERELEEEKQRMDSYRVEWTSVSASLQKCEEESTREKKQLAQSQNSLLKMQDESKKLREKIRSLTQENEMLMKEVTKVTELYKNLNEQLVEMTRNTDGRKAKQMRLEAETNELRRALDAATEETADVVRRYEEELKRRPLNVSESDRLIKVREQLHQECKRREETERKCEELQVAVKEKEIQLGEMQAESLEQQRLQAEAKQHSEFAARDRERLVQEKTALVQQVNSCVESIQEEKTRLETKLVEARVELEAATATRSTLEAENCRLLERVAELERQADSGGQLQTVMAELLQSKQKLSYDKGQLQTKVEGLQLEVEKLGDATGQLQTARRSLAAVETKFHRSQQELSQCRVQLGEMESQLRQKEQVSSRRQRDFSVATEARDEAVREAERLLAHCEALEERERQRVAALQRSVEEARGETRRAKEGLDTALNQNTQLQRTAEHLQQELGSREACLAQEKHARKMAEERVRSCQGEVDKLLAKVTSQEQVELTEVQPLRQLVQQLKTEQTRHMTLSEELNQKNEELRAALNQLREELSRTEQLANQERLQREEDATRSQSEIRAVEDRLNTLRQQLANERARGVQRTADSAQELEMLRVQMEQNASAANQEREELRAQLQECNASEQAASRRVSELQNQTVSLRQTNREMQSELRQWKMKQRSSVTAPVYYTEYKSVSPTPIDPPPPPPPSTPSLPPALQEQPVREVIHASRAAADKLESYLAAHAGDLPPVHCATRARPVLQAERDFDAFLRGRMNNLKSGSLSHLDSIHRDLFVEEIGSSSLNTPHRQVYKHSDTSQFPGESHVNDGEASS